MHERFLQYIRVKGLSQHKLSELSCVSVSTISRFCSGSAIASDKLLKLLQVCDDLSLDWLFYNSGEMIRHQGATTVNMGAFAGADVVSDEGVMMKGSGKMNVSRGGVAEYERLLREKDDVIAARDRVISERDAMIRSLHERLLSSGGVR